MQNVYTANATIPVVGNDAAIIATLENPSDSGVMLAIVALVERDVGYGAAPALIVRRYTGTISAILADGSAIPVPQPHLITSPAAAGVVRTIVSHTFGSAPGDPTFEVQHALLAMTAGFAGSAPVLLAPGETGALWSAEGGGGVPIGFAVQWIEIPVTSATEHIASAALPGDGAWTSATPLALSSEWAQITCIFSYTAANPSTNACPKARVVWNDGVGSFQQPIADTTLGTPGAAVATRYVRQLVELFDVVSAGVSVTHTITYAIPKGALTARLDLAESGDMAHPGTVVARIMGG